jgi:hypothetical protein
MSRLMLLGAGGPTVAAGPSLWNPGNESSLVSWFDTSADRYDGTTWTKRWGAGGNMAKFSTGPSEVTNAFPSGTQRALVFTGNSDTELRLTPTATTEFISVSVFRFTTRAADAEIIARNATDGRLFTFSFGGLRATYLNGYQDNYDTETLDPHIVVARHSKASRILRVDGTEIINDAVGVTGTETGTDPFRLGVYTGSAVNWTMQLTAFAIFNNSGWSTGLAQKIEGYLAWDSVGMSAANLPVGHPYKSAAPTV